MLTGLKRRLLSKLKILGVGSSKTAKNKGVEKALFVVFKKAPLIGKIFHDGKNMFRVVDKYEGSDRRWHCQIEPV